MSRCRPGGPPAARSRQAASQAEPKADGRCLLEGGRPLVWLREDVGGGSSAGQSKGLIIPGSRVRAPPAPLHVSPGERHIQPMFRGRISVAWGASGRREAASASDAALSRRSATRLRSPGPSPPTASRPPTGAPDGGVRCPVRPPVPGQRCARPSLMACVGHRTGSRCSSTTPARRPVGTGPARRPCSRVVLRLCAASPPDLLTASWTPLRASKPQHNTHSSTSTEVQRAASWGYLHPTAGLAACADRLVAALLWEPAADGWEVHDFLELPGARPRQYQTTKSQLDGARKSARERKQKERDKQRASASRRDSASIDAGLPVDATASATPGQTGMSRRDMGDVTAADIGAASGEE